MRIEGGETRHLPRTRQVLALRAIGLRDDEVVADIGGLKGTPPRLRRCGARTDRLKARLQPRLRGTGRSRSFVIIRWSGGFSRFVLAAFLGELAHTRWPKRYYKGASGNSVLGAAGAFGSTPLRPQRDRRQPKARGVLKPWVCLRLSPHRFGCDPGEVCYRSAHQPLLRVFGSAHKTSPSLATRPALFRMSIAAPVRTRFPSRTTFLTTRAACFDFQERD